MQFWQRKALKKKKFILEHVKKMKYVASFLLSLRNKCMEDILRRIWRKPMDFFNFRQQYPLEFLQVYITIIQGIWQLILETRLWKRYGIENLNFHSWRLPWMKNGSLGFTQIVSRIRYWEYPRIPNKPSSELYEKLATFDGASLAIIPHVLAFLRNILKFEKTHKYVTLKLFTLSLGPWDCSWIKHSRSLLREIIP